MLSSVPCFPSGAAGIGLVLLRASVAYSFMLTVYLENLVSWQQLGLIAAALGIIAGFHARTLAMLCLLLVVDRIIGPEPPYINGLAFVLSTTALALLGPGAFSIDSRLFGRKILVMPISSGDPRT